MTSWIEKPANLTLEKMTPDLHAIDILYSIWTYPIRRRDTLAGLTVITQVFKSGEYLHSCSVLEAWLSRYRESGTIFIDEFARGPSGCFDSIMQGHPDLFQVGPWLTGPQADNLPGEEWFPPTETKKIVDLHGSFVTLEFIDQWINGLTP